MRKGEGWERRGKEDIRKQVRKNEEGNKKRRIKMEEIEGQKQETRK